MYQYLLVMFPDGVCGGWGGNVMSLRFNLVEGGALEALQCKYIRFCLMIKVMFLLLVV